MYGRFKREDLPDDKRLLQMKWVFKLKSDNRFRERLVAMGFRQIPGIDYQTAHSPVLTDISFHLIIILKLQRGWDMMALDIEKAFLEPTLDEDIFISAPQVLEYTTNIDRKTSICKINKAIYGLVQAARIFYNTITEFLRKLGFKISSIDPCLAIKITKDGTIIIGIYVDDLIMIGDNKLLEETMTRIKEKIGIRIKYPVNEYVGCELIHYNNSIILYQQKITNDLYNTFKDELTINRTYK